MNLRNSELDWKKAMSENRIEDPSLFAEFMLSKTSRTFALNIQVLPSDLRTQVLLAYLFCRIADTLEDDAELEITGKLAMLEEFRGLFPPSADYEMRVARFLASLPESWKNSERWDRLLVAHCHWIFPLLHGLPRLSVTAISGCVREMCEGMLRFTSRQTHGSSSLGQPVLIETLEDLDQYCYYVAGTVGNLLCELFSIHSPLISVRKARILKSLSVSFGLGLQLTNILKDIHEDRMRNISFIPMSMLSQEKLDAKSFLTPEGRDGAKRILLQLIRKAKVHLEDALEYSCLLPRLEPRLRLFCLWPLFMAAETMLMIADNLEGIQDETKMKISRAQVKGIIRKTSLACWSNHLVRKMFHATMVGLETSLARASAPAEGQTLARLATGTIGGR